MRFRGDFLPNFAPRGLKIGVKIAYVNGDIKNQRIGQIRQIFKGHINRNGDAHLRSLLYVIAFASIRCNSACKEMYERLRARGKSGKVAIVAVANKLIRLAFAVVTNNRPYIDGYVSTLA